MSKRSTRSSDPGTSVWWLVLPLAGAIVGAAIPSSAPSAGRGACSVHFWESPQALSRISHRRSGTGSRHRRSINGSPRCLRFPARSARQGEGPACSDLRPALLTDLGGKHQSDDDVESAHKSPEDQVSQIDPHP